MELVADFYKVLESIKSHSLKKHIWKGAIVDGVGQSFHENLRVGVRNLLKMGKSMHDCI